MKRYIYAMSFAKAEAIERASKYSSAIIEHLIKILVYGDIRQDDVAHWIGEIATWLKSVDRISVKPTNRRLKPNVIRDTLFRSMGDELGDYLDSLEAFQYDNRRGKFNYSDKTSYPEVEPTIECAGDLMNMCLDLIEEATPLLSDKYEHSRQEYVSLLTKIVSKYK